MAVGSGGLYAAPTVSLRKEGFEKLHVALAKHLLEEWTWWISGIEDRRTFIATGNPLLRTLLFLESQEISRNDAIQVFWGFENERRLFSFRIPLSCSWELLLFCLKRVCRQVKELQKQILSTELQNRSTNHQKSQSSMWWRSGVEDSTLLPQFVCERRIGEITRGFSEASGVLDGGLDEFLKSKTERSLLWSKIRCWERSYSHHVLVSSAHSARMFGEMKSILNFWMRANPDKHTVFGFIENSSAFHRGFQAKRQSSAANSVRPKSKQL